MRLALLPLFASTLIGANLSGIWTGSIAGRNDQVVDVAFQFVQTGETVTGKLYGDYQSTAISEGRVNGDQITFVVVTKEQAGNQINETRLRFTGVLKDGELELTRERESSRNAGNAGAAPVRNNAKQVFRVKRLI